MLKYNLFFKLTHKSNEFVFHFTRMPGFGPKFFICILCNCRTKPKNQKHVNKDTAKYLLKYFMIEAMEGEIICSTCIP